jgi:hypothetical protein
MDRTCDPLQITCPERARTFLNALPLVNRESESFSCVIT